MLALFPLEVVLFPGMSLPLHIFEPRYQQMFGDCRTEGTPFGVVLESNGEMAEVGCTAEVVRVMRHYPDGRLDLLAEGRDRFRIVATDASLPYLRGKVEWLEDPHEDLAEERAQVLDLYRRTYWAHGQGVPPSHVEAAARMSYAVARSQLLDLPDRQRLLEMPSERERLAAIGEALAELEPLVRTISGNGHGSR